MLWPVGVEHPLLGDQAAQRGLETVEGGDGHRVMPGGRGRGGRAGRPGAEPVARRAGGSRPRARRPISRVRCERNVSSWRISARLMPCSRAISASSPRSSAERSMAARGGAGRDERAQALERDGRGGDAEGGAGALQQRRCAPSRARRGGTISDWMSASRASTASVSRSRIAAPWARTSLSRWRAELICASRWTSSSASSDGAHDDCIPL